MRRWAVVALVLLAGCSVRVNKDGNGEEKDVHVAMPFGHVDVHKDAGGGTTELGLPLYPGAVPDEAKGKDRAVDVHVGFGPWKVRVQAAEYRVRDPEEKVEAFYKKALAQYGTVLTCKGKVPVGEPARTAQGLSCQDEGKGGPRESGGDLQLKAGSPSKQHVVAFHEVEGEETRFALLALELPRGDSGEKSEE